MRFSVKRLLIVVTVIACVLGFLRISYIGLAHVKTGENHQSVDWLPASATNVSFYKSYPATAYEFDIPEADFSNWASWDLKPISKPVTVVRYSHFTVDVPAPGANATQAERDAFFDTRQATVTDGLYYLSKRPNGGGVQVAYDREHGRAYFYSAPR